MTGFKFSKNVSISSNTTRRLINTLSLFILLNISYFIVILSNLSIVFVAFLKQNSHNFLCFYLMFFNLKIYKQLNDKLEAPIIAPTPSRIIRKYCFRHSFNFPYSLHTILCMNLYTVKFFLYF